MYNIGYLMVSSPNNNSSEISTAPGHIKCTRPDLQNDINYEPQCNGAILTLMPQDVECNGPVCATEQNSVVDYPGSTHNYECDVEHMTFRITCSNSIPPPKSSRPPTDTEGTGGSTTSPITGTSNEISTSTALAGTNRIPPNSVDIIPILLAVIIGLMALFICIMIATMIIRKLRKRKHRYTINGSRDLIHQENIYQTGDGNRRPSRIIPIVTHGGECLEMSEFPRYNDIGNHHKLSNASLSMSCEKGAFLGDQLVPMATGSNPNGGYPQQHFYSIIPANKVGHSKHHSESYFPGQRDHGHPRTHTPQVHITHSSQASPDADIDPYSTLDEARNEAMVEIRSTHTLDEQSDDILMLNMFGSDKPKWTHDVRPVRLNVPTNRSARGRISVGDEDEYITMTGGDLEGGWGEVRTRAHMRGFDTTDGLRKGHEHKGGFDLSEKVQYNRPTHNIVSHPPQMQELRENEVETDEAPPSPDEGIEDLYAKVRKKSKRSESYSESSDDEVTYIVDDNESPSQRDYLIPPNPQFAEDMKMDQALHKEQKHNEMTPVQPPPSGENGSTSQGDRDARNTEIQAGKTAKQALGNTRTL